jgi:ankyrin repeat protein
LLAKGADPNINTMGYTAFLLAAGAGPGGRGGAAGAPPNMQILDLLIQHSADVNAKVTGTKTYSFSVSRENLGNKDALSKEGTSALHEAARSGQTELVKYLLDHGAKPDLLDADGKKPIDVIGVQRAGRGGGAPVAAAGQAKGNRAAGAAPGAGAGRAPGRGGANPAAVAEIRALLQNAGSKQPSLTR